MRWRRWLLIGCLTALLAGGGVLVWHRLPQRQAFYTDAATIRQPQATVRPRDILWQPPVPLSQIVNTTAHDYEPRISWDGLTLFFVRGKAGHNADIYWAKRTPDGWTDPLPLEAVNSPYDDLGPEPSADGQSLYFYSDRPGGCGGYDLCVARRVDDRWDAAAHLGPAVNSEFNDYGPALTPDGKTLYFSSNRPQPGDRSQPNPQAWPATVREERFQRTYDLYESPLTERGPGQAQPLAALNTTYDEGAPCVSPVGDFLYFASNRPGGQGGFDLYRVRCLDGGFRAADNLGPSINTAANELDPGLTALGYGLYFSSDRPTGDSPPGESNDYNLYHTTSREVFADVETEYRPPINWAALWQAVWPNLLWALLALLLLLSLLAVLRDARRRKLGLLARCLLASLAAHVLLMFLLSFWNVTASVVSALRGRGEIRVALSPAGQGQALAAQIRGQLTEVSLPEVRQFEIARPQPTTDVQPLDARATLTVARQAWTANEQLPVETASQDAPEPPLASPVRESAVEHLLRPDTLAVALPTEVRKIDTDESHAKVETAAADNAAVQRPDVTLPVSQSAQLMHAVTFVPAGGSSLEAMDTRRSLAGTAESRDAVPADHPRALDAVQVAELDAPPALALSLPAETAKALQSAEAPATRVAVAESSTVERAPPDQTLVESAAGLAKEQRIEPTVTVTGGDTPLPTADVAAAEAQPRAASPSLSSADVGASRLPLAELALGSPQEAARVQQVEPGPAPRAADVEIDRPEVTTVVSTEGSAMRATLAELAPDGREPESSPGSRLARPDTSPREAQAPMRLPAIGEPSEPPPPGSRDALALRLRVPAGASIPNESFWQRDPQRRRQLLQRLGGTAETERAVELALKWLAAHQSKDGHWDGLHFDAECSGCGGQTEAKVDAALTGLSLQCFLGAGHTHTGDSPYRENVARALVWLLNHQGPDGDLRDGETMYSQGIATIALAEAYGMTLDAVLYDAATRAVEFIHGARNVRTGGWRYNPEEPDDTSVLGWQVMALNSAETAGIQVPRGALESAAQWLDSVETQTGRYAYRPGEPATTGMTAEAMFVRQLLGTPRDHPRQLASEQVIAATLPDWDREPDTYTWYYTTLALFHHRGPSWPRWNEAVTRELLDHQQTDGPRAGSWEPVGQWAASGGRVYQTALCTLMLEVYYRYLPTDSLDRPVSVGPPVPANAIGTVHGRITDATTGQPLPAATMRLDLPNQEPLIAEAGANGTYTMHVPPVPDHFAISASHEGYVPQSADISAARVRRGAVTQDFALDPNTEAIIALEDTPEVHHLGNDRWTGRVNSQFQKTAEGRNFRADFQVTSGQLAAAAGHASLHLLAKGVQCPHRIYINGHLLEQRMSKSPTDGSFGEFSIPFDPAFLIDGANTLEIRGVSCSGDLDDFEFVNAQVHLSRGLSP